VYYFKYIYHRENLTTIAMVVLLLVAMVCIPVSVPVSKRIGKRLTYQIGLGFFALACLVLYFAGHLLGPGFFFAMMSVAGIGLGFTFVAPWAMVPDTIEWDAAKSGERREGVYYGMWTFVTQCGQALSIGLPGLLLSASGYIAEAEQGPRSIAAIRLLLGPLPAALFIAGIALLSAYPITEKVYNELMRDGKVSG
jgi:Na+/melibiose symporter and related transporters